MVWNSLSYGREFLSSHFNLNFIDKCVGHFSTLLLSVLYGQSDSLVLVGIAEPVRESAQKKKM